MRMRSSAAESLSSLPAMPVKRGQASGLSPEQLLLVWLSPAFPVGAFAYSHGLEMAVERGLVGCQPTLAAWLHDLAELGSLKNDLILAAVAWRHATAGDWQSLADTAETAAALQPSAERYLEATQQGASFVQQIEASWPSAAVGEALAKLGVAGFDGQSGTPIAYPVAVGVAAAGHAIPCRAMLDAYGVTFVGNLVSAAIRLSVVGQTLGQQTVAALAPAIGRAVGRAEAATLDDLGSASFRADLVSLQHETQHTRLFRS